MKIKFRTILLIPAAALLFSCSPQKADQGEEAASVNGTPIYTKELVREVNAALKREPGMRVTGERVDEILGTLIDRKLLIDEAVKMGLSEDERFLESIKSFWEQTLIRELVEAKNKEWAGRLVVTDEEVRERYGLMRSKVTVRLIRAGSAKDAEAALARLDSEGAVAGPLFVEDLSPSDPLIGAFAMAEGARAVLAGDGRFYACEVLKKEPSGALSLEEIYEAVKSKLLEEKKARALDEWIEARKKAASIKVYRDAIERLR